jgi:hypothetical protein
MMHRKKILLYLYLAISGFLIFFVGMIIREMLFEKEFLSKTYETWQFVPILEEPIVIEILGEKCIDDIRQEKNLVSAIDGELISVLAEECLKDITSGSDLCTNEEYYRKQRNSYCLISESRFPNAIDDLCRSMKRDWEQVKKIARKCANKRKNYACYDDRLKQAWKLYWTLEVNEFSKASACLSNKAWTLLQRQTEISKNDNMFPNFYERLKNEIDVNKKLLRDSVDSIRLIEELVWHDDIEKARAIWKSEFPNAHYTEMPVVP